MKQKRGEGGRGNRLETKESKGGFHKLGVSKYYYVESKILRAAGRRWRASTELLRSLFQCGVMALTRRTCFKFCGVP